MLPGLGSNQPSSTNNSIGYAPVLSNVVRVQRPRRLPAITPINSLSPTAKDKQLTKDLVEFLQEKKMYPTPENDVRRAEALAELTRVIQQVIEEVTKEKSLTLEFKGYLLPFGSYRLGVHNEDSDIDLVCIGPPHVDKLEFFDKTYLALLRHPGVTGFVQRIQAAVPVIKLEFMNFEIDLGYSRALRNDVPEDLQVADDQLYNYVANETVGSFNGPRVADDILSLVPNQENFRIVLRAVKLWAKCKAFNSNMIGFLGGVHVGIMTAQICQFFPNASPSHIFMRFFQVYARWNWPTPVRLTNTPEDPSRPLPSFAFMPILTPTFPSMCASTSVSHSTHYVMVKAFNEAHKIARDIEKGEKTWSDMFAPSDFFNEYRYYIQIKVSSDSEKKHADWNGFIEWRLRHLLMSLEEANYNAGNELVIHPYPHGFDRHKVSVSSQIFARKAAEALHAGVDNLADASVVETQIPKVEIPTPESSISMSSDSSSSGSSTPNRQDSPENAGRKRKHPGDCESENFILDVKKLRNQDENARKLTEALGNCQSTDVQEILKNKNTKDLVRLQNVIQETISSDTQTKARRTFSSTLEVERELSIQPPTKKIIRENGMDSVVCEAVTANAAAAVRAHSVSETSISVSESVSLSSTPAKTFVRKKANEEDNIDNEPKDFNTVFYLGLLFAQSEEGQKLRFAANYDRWLKENKLLFLKNETNTWSEDLIVSVKSVKRSELPNYCFASPLPARRKITKPKPVNSQPTTPLATPPTAKPALGPDQLKQQRQEAKEKYMMQKSSQLQELDTSKFYDQINQGRLRAPVKPLIKPKLKMKPILSRK